MFSKSVAILLALCCAVHHSNGRTTPSSAVLPVQTGDLERGDVGQAASKTPNDSELAGTSANVPPNVPSDREIQDFIFDSMFNGIRKGISRMFDTMQAISESSPLGPIPPSSSLSNRLNGIRKEISTLFDIIAPSSLSAASSSPSSTAQPPSTSSQGNTATSQPTSSSSQTSSSATFTATTSSNTRSSSQTTQSETSTTQANTPAATSAATSTPSSTSLPSICPEGQYDTKTDTVTFILEERNCEITVYLRKPPKSNKGRGAGRAGKSNKADKFIDVSPRFGNGIDACPEVRKQMYGKDTFVMETNECVMIVSRDKRKGRAPSIISRSFS